MSSIHSAGTSPTKVVDQTASSATGGTLGAQGKMGQQDFLQLLIAQLKNQDPLKPTDDKEFIGQVAQFNQLEQMQELNKTMTGLGSALALSQASNLLGRQVVAQTADGATQGIVTGVTLGASGVQVQIGGKAVVALAAVQQVGLAPTSSSTSTPAATTSTTTGSST